MITREAVRATARLNYFQIHFEITRQTQPDDYVDPWPTTLRPARPPCTSPALHPRVRGMKGDSVALTNLFDNFSGSPRPPRPYDFPYLFTDSTAVSLLASSDSATIIYRPENRSFVEKGTFWKCGKSLCF